MCDLIKNVPKECPNCKSPELEFSDTAHCCSIGIYCNCCHHLYEGTMGPPYFDGHMMLTLKEIIPLNQEDNHGKRTNKRWQDTGPQSQAEDCGRAAEAGFLGDQSPQEK